MTAVPAGPPAGVSFQPATQVQRPLRLLLSGPPAGGKTLTALRIAQGLAGDGRIALIDTERSTAALYSSMVSFDCVNLPNGQAEQYLAAIQQAITAGYTVLIIDSLTAAWSGVGGVLEHVDEVASQMRNPNTYAAWQAGGKVQNRLIDAVLNFPGHVICTVRSKIAHAQERNAQGRTTIRKLGEAIEQRKGLEYEFDLVASCHDGGEVVFDKSRFPRIPIGHSESQPDHTLGQRLLAVLANPTE